MQDTTGPNPHPQHQPPATMKPILISGAGLSSLLLARALRAANIPIRIFERDASISFRGQGYRLRLSDEGLDAIESVLTSPGVSPPTAWQDFWDACGQTGGAGFAVIDALTGEEIKPSASEQGGQQKPSPSSQSVGGGGDSSSSSSSAGTPGPSNKADGIRETLHSRNGKIIGIARGDMRRLFLQGLEEDIEWNRQVTGYELIHSSGSSTNTQQPATTTGVRALFADGTSSVEGSMLIGGEGIHSLVAKQLSKGRLKVYDTGARGIHGQAPTGAFAGLGEGVFRILDNGGPSSSHDSSSSSPSPSLSIITNVRSRDMHNPNLSFGWTMVGQPGILTAPDNNYSVIGLPAAKIAKSLTSNWHPRVKSVIDQMNENEAAFWKITCSNACLEDGVPEWENDPRVTVIGDAVHSMTPAGGLGANTAVRDSALLGRLIVEAGGFKEGVTAAYEKEMRVYGSEMVAKSYGMAKSQMGIRIDENSPTI